MTKPRKHYHREPCPKCTHRLKSVTAAMCLTCRREEQRKAKGASARICSTKDCGARLHYRNTSGRCQRCIDRARHESAARVAAGQPSTEDQLRVENTELRASLRQQQTAIRRAAANQRLEQSMLEAFQQTLKANPYRTQFTPPPAPNKRETAHEMLALVSDAHYPEVVDPEACFGITYGPEICRRRLQYLRDKILRYRALRAAAYPVRRLTIVVNGDMLGGVIHDELEVTNAMPLSQALIDMAYMLYDLGLGCAREFPTVEMIIMPGNHARLTKKPRAKEKWNNWEWVMGKFVEALAGKQFKVIVPKDLVYRHEIFGRWVGITHGDGVKVQSFAGIPFYALDRRRNAFQQLLRSLGLPQVDLLVYGHFHRALWDDDLGFLINGSIKGGDEYSISSFYRASPPVQLLVTMHPKHWITDLSRINLDRIT